MIAIREIISGQVLPPSVRDVATVVSVYVVRPHNHALREVVAQTPK